MEVLFKVGDSGGYRDGDIIAVKPDGWLISRADMTAYLRDGTEPAVLASMPKYKADVVRRMVLAIRWKLAHTAAEIETEYKLLKGEGEHQLTEAASDKAALEAFGNDTNWGMLDLRHHAVLKVADGTLDDIRELVDHDRNVDHVGEIVGKARYRVPYDTVLDAARVAAIRDREQLVPVVRTEVLPKAIIVPASRVIAIERER